jgi:hypothetical protein
MKIHMVRFKVYIFTVIVAKQIMKYKVYCKDEYVFVGYGDILWYFISEHVSTAYK